MYHLYWSLCNHYISAVSHCKAWIAINYANRRQLNWQGWSAVDKSESNVHKEILHFRDMPVEKVYGKLCENLSSSSQVSKLLNLQKYNFYAASKTGKYAFGIYICRRKKTLIALCQHPGVSRIWTTTPRTFVALTSTPCGRSSCLYRSRRLRFFCGSSRSRGVRNSRGSWGSPRGTWCNSWFCGGGWFGLCPCCRVGGFRGNYLSWFHTCGTRHGT